MKIKFLILFHLIGACVWVGGHLVLALSVLPKALKEGDPNVIRDFEEQLERMGIPALILQTLTGLWIAAIYVGVGNWFSFDNEMTARISVKLTLLIITILLAVHTRFFIIPKLSEENLSFLALHIIAITIVALALLFTGLKFRLNFI